MNASFPAAVRLLRKRDFEACFQARRRLSGAYYLLHYRWQAPEEAAGARLGLAIGRKVDTRAVVRNRLRRISREVFRQHPLRGQPVDLILTARADAASVARPPLHAELNQLFDRLLATRPHALPSQTAAGTMPAAEAESGPDPAMPASSTAPATAAMQSARTPRS